MEGVESVEALTLKLKEAAVALYRGTDDVERKNADKWLTQFQCTPQAWQVSDALLQLSDDQLIPELQFLAAQTLNVKIRFDYAEQLPAESRPSLRDSLLKYLVRHCADGKAKHAVVKQLSLAVAALGLQMEEWTTMLADLGKFLGAEVSTIPCLVELLEVIPEEHDKENSALQISEARYVHVRNEMLAAGKDVLDYLVKCLALNSQPLKRKVFNCLRSWITHVHLSGVLLASTPLIPDLFASLNVPELFEPSVNALIAIMHAFQSPSNADELAVIEMVVPRVFQLGEVFTRATAEEDEELAVGLCRLFTHMAEAYIPMLLGPEQMQQNQLLDLVLLCLQHPSHEVAEHTLGFWLALIDGVIRLEAQVRSDHILERFLPYMDRLCAGCLNHLQLRDEYHDGSMDVDAKEDFDDIRDDIIDVLIHISYIRSGAKLLSSVTDDLLAEASAYASVEAERVQRWPRVEARVFAFMGIFEVVPLEQKDSSERIARVLDVLIQLPISHHKLRNSCTRAVGRYAPWLGRSGDMRNVRPFFEYMRAGLAYREVAVASAWSIKHLCKYAPIGMAELGAEMLQVANAQSVGWHERLDIIEGFALVTSHQPYQQALEAMKIVAAPACRVLENVTVVNAKQEEQSVAFSLEILVILIRFGRPARGAGDPAAHPFGPILQEVWPSLEKLIRLYIDVGRIIELIVKLLKDSIRGFHEAFNQVLNQTMDLLVSAYTTKPVSSFLYAAGIAIEKYGAHQQYHAYFVNVLTTLFNKTFTFLTNEAAFDEYPDNVEDLFSLGDRALKAMAESFVPMDIFRLLFQCACMGALVQHREASHSLLLFIENALLLVVPSKTRDNRHLRLFVDRAMGDGHGRRLMTSLIAGIAGQLPRSRLQSRSDGSLTATLDAFLRYLGNENAKAMGLMQAFDAPSCAHVNKELAQTFVQNVVKAHATRDSDFLRVIEEFSDKARLRLKRKV